MRIRAQRLRAGGERNRRPVTEFDAHNQLSVDADVEPELVTLANRELGHHLRKAPDCLSRFQSEGLIDQHLVSEGRLQRPQARAVGSGRVDHYTSAEFVIGAQVTVYEFGEYQLHERTPGQ